MPTTNFSVRAGIKLIDHGSTVHDHIEKGSLIVDESIQQRRDRAPAGKLSCDPRGRCRLGNRMQREKQQTDKAP